MRLPKEMEEEILSQEQTKQITFDSMVRYLRSSIDLFPDKRTGSNKTYSLEDVALGAFSIFFTQCPSFLAFQIAMQKNTGLNNAKSLFGIQTIPSDNHIRNLMDEVNPSQVFPVFTRIIEDMKRLGHLNMFRSYNGNLVCALDGTQYFSSNKIHCENCNTKEHKNGTITYSHTAITPVFVAPGINKVISLPPVFITPQDGNNKQDCENTAAKRWLNQYAPLLKELGVTITGDDLYCKHPITSLILELGLDFIIVCKPDSHKILYQWIGEMQAMGAVETVTEKRWTGKTYIIDTYRFVNQVPIRDGKDAQQVNWCEITTTLPDGTILYRNAFVTNFVITKNNVKQIVADGRARWKVENENNNVLKNNGYNLEHNFGHGKKYLSQFMLTLNLLAFLFHTVLEVVDQKYKLIRSELPTRKTFFDDIRALTRYIYFESWDAMLIFMIRGLQLKVPDTG